MNYKLLTIITLAVLSVSAVYLIADADGSDAAVSVTDGDWTFNVVDGNATLVSYIGETTNNLVVPSSVSDGTNTYNVTIFGDGTGSVISNSLLSSGSSVVLPSGLTTISDMSFFRDMNLASVTIPDGVTSIGASAFNTCMGLTTINLPDSITAIGSYAFGYCTSLTTTEILAGASYGSSVYSNCTGFTSLTFGANIPNDSFKSCSGLTSIEILDGVTTIGTGAFMSCTGLTTIEIPDSITTIGNFAFDSCSNVTELIVKGTPETIGTDAFNMSALETVYNLGENDTIVAGAYGIPSTATVLRSMNTFTYSIVDNHAVITGTTGDTWDNIEIPSVIVDNNNLYIVTAIGSGTDAIITDEQIPTTATLTIPDGVTTINDHAFAGCTHITGSLTIPDGVTIIGDSAFYSCSGFTGTLTIPDGVTNIGSSVFSGCSGLTSAIIPAGFTQVNDSLFSSCSGLTTVSIPNSVIQIGNYAFGHCSALTSVSLPIHLRNIGQASFQYSGLTGTLTIPDSVTFIGASAFGYCTGLTGLDLGAGVVTIKNQVFTNCTSLTGTLIIPASVDVIEDNAFTHTAFNSLVFLGSPSSVGSDVFGQSIKEVLNLGTNEVTTTSYGLNADEVRNDIPGSSYIAPNTVTKRETNDGPAYDIIILLPLIMIMGVVLIAIWGLRDKF